MSEKLFHETYVRYRGKGSKRLVMMALAYALSDSGSGSASIRHIASLAHASETTTKRVLRSLKRQGWIFVKSGRSAGRFCPNVYQLHVKRLMGQEVCFRLDSEAVR